MKGYVAYVRVSTVKQGKKGSSLQERRTAIENYARRHGLVIATWFEEQETAAKQGRPGTGHFTWARDPQDKCESFSLPAYDAMLLMRPITHSVTEEGPHLLPLPYPNLSDELSAGRGDRRRLAQHQRTIHHD
jgi:hypothetical protein